MKHLTWKLILPLTVISFITITKSWSVCSVDAPDTMCSGFPFPYVCNGWHTSMSLQIFVLELIVDAFVYFLFWFALVFCINNFLRRIKISKIVTTGLWTIAGIMLLGAMWIACSSDIIFHAKRPFEMSIKETGVSFFWQIPNPHENYK